LENLLKKTSAQDSLTISDLQSKLAKTKKQLQSALAPLESPLVQNPVSNYNLCLNETLSSPTETHRIQSPEISGKKRKNETTTSQLKNRKFDTQPQIMEEEPKMNNSMQKNKTPDSSFQKSSGRLFLFGEENKAILNRKELKFTTERLPPYTPIIKRLQTIK